MSEIPPPKIGVMIATPCRHWRGSLKETFGEQYNAQIEALQAMSQDAECPYEFNILISTGGLVRTRNEMAATFKASGCRFLIPADDDLNWTPADILKLLSHKRPFVAALYTTREDRPHWVANFMHEVTLQKGGLYQVIEVGTGLQCIHREVFLILERVHPGMVYTDRDSGRKMFGYYQHCVLQTDLKPDGDLLTEDFFFCYLARLARIGIFVDTTIKLKHCGGDGVAYPKGDWPPIPGLDEKPEIKDRSVRLAEMRDEAALQERNGG